MWKFEGTITIARCAPISLPALPVRRMKSACNSKAPLCLFLGVRPPGLLRSDQDAGISEMYHRFTGSRAIDWVVGERGVVGGYYLYSMIL